MDKVISAIERGIIYSGYILCAREISSVLAMAKSMAKAAKTTPYIIEEPSMEKIRGLQTALYEDVTKGDAKMAIIYSDDLSDRCQNAMLKTIEDHNSVISVVFITTNLSVLLPTIISRCILVYPDMEKEEDIVKVVGEENRLYARYSFFSLEKAQELMATGSFKEDRDISLDILQNFISGKPYIIPKENSVKIGDYLKYIQLFLRDALTGNIYWYYDRADIVNTFINSFTMTQIIGIIKIVQKAGERLYKKANPQLTFDMVQLGVLEVINGRSNRNKI